MEGGAVVYKLNGKGAFLFIIIALAVAAVVDGRPQRLHDVEVLVNSSFTNVQAAGQLGRRSGTFDPDEVVDAYETQKYFLHGNKVEMKG